MMNRLATSRWKMDFSVTNGKRFAATLYCNIKWSHSVPRQTQMTMYVANVDNFIIWFPLSDYHYLWLPITTLQHLLTNVKGKGEPNNRPEVIYRIKSSNCPASYIGETGQNLNPRLNEHKQLTRNGEFSNHIPEHHRLTNHTIICI